MFIEQADRASLRQGDIVEGIPFPLSRIEEVRYLGLPKTVATDEVGKLELEPILTPVGKSPTLWLTAQMYSTVAFCAVLSQCCEIDPNQNPPPKTFTLCRLVPVPDGIRKRTDLYQALKDNVDPYGDIRPFYALFYVGAHSKLNNEYVVDFSQAMTVRWTDYGTVLRRKVLQLDDLHRAKFRVKVGAYFGRPTSEELQAGIADPWHSTGQDQLNPLSLSKRIVRAFRLILGQE
jgi:hypothetical protein